MNAAKTPETLSIDAVLVDCHAALCGRHIEGLPSRVRQAQKDLKALASENEGFHRMFAEEHRERLGKHDEARKLEQQRDTLAAALERLLSDLSMSGAEISTIVTSNATIIEARAALKSARGE